MLRAHQIRGARAALRQFEFGGRATVVFPGGAGKTVLGAAVVESLKAPLSLVVAPTLALVDQTAASYATWTAYAPSETMLVCHRTSRRGVGRSTDAAAVARFLAERRDDRALLLSTYRSLPVVAAALRAAGRRADVGVFDEAHVTTFRGDGHGLATDANLDCARRLYLTATPRLLRAPRAEPGIAATPAAFGAPTAARSMDDAKLYGPVVDAMAAEEAQNAGVTVPLDVVVLNVARGWDADVAKTLEGLDVAVGDAEVAVALKRAAEDHGCSRALVFHNSNARAARFVEACDRVFAKLDGGVAVASARVSGAAKPRERERTLDFLRSDARGLRLLSNARLLVTGVDVPAVDAVVVADPRHGHLGIAQLAARAARASAGKRRGVVLVPVRVEDGAELAPDDFATVLSVLRALGSNDDAFARALAADEPDDGGGAPRGARGPRSLLDGRLTVDAGVRLEDVAAAVRTSVLKLASTWDDRFEALKKFAERTGRANPSRRDVDGDSGLDLHRWAARQKRAHRRGHLSRDRVDRLESIGFDFHVRGSDAAFRRALELYKDPPADPRAWYRCRDWLRRQRQLYHAGELAEHRRALLEAAGVDWGSGPRGPPPDVAKADDRAFDAALAAHDAYVSEHGASPPSRDGTRVFCGGEEVWRLGPWVRATRHAHAQGKLPADRVAKLVASRFDFDPIETLWDTHFEATLAFRRDHGHSAVPRYARGHALHRLGEWGERQRRARRLGVLRPDREARLEAAGFEWAAGDRTKAWDASKRYAKAVSSDAAVHLLAGRLGAPAPRLDVRAKPACRCGSTTHSRVTSLECPLNPRLLRQRKASVALRSS